MVKENWICKNLQGVKSLYAIYLIFNLLQYLFSTLLGARGYAVMISGLQYLDASLLRNGVIIYIAGVLATAVCGGADTVMKAKVECGIRLQKKQELLRTNMYQKAYGQEHSAKIHEIMTVDLENVISFLGTQIPNLLTPVIVSVVCIMAIFQKSIVIAIIMCFSMLLAAIINLYFLPRLHDQMREVRELENSLATGYTDTIFGSAVIRVFSYQKYYLEKVKCDIKNVLNAQTEEVKIRFMQGVAVNLLSYSSMTVPFLAGAVLTAMGKMNLATMMYITQLSGNLLWFVNIFTNTMTEIQKVRISKERIAELENESTEGKYSSQSRAAEEKGWPEFVSDSIDAVKMEHLCVELDGRQILKDISLDIPKGAFVAFVGKSGCGKTTIFKTLQDMVPYQGSVSLFGQNADKLSEQQRYSLMSYVSQDVGLIQGSIYKNILLGNQRASREEVEEAAKMAMADTFVRNLESGYETQIAENGSTLSGGEKQRIALARGYIKDAPIIMLDEVTSALDPSTEDAVMSVLEGLRHRYTVLIIAHRIDTVQKADKIFCMKDGEIIAQGTHEDLMKDCREYQCLVKGGQ